MTTRNIAMFAAAMALPFAVFVAIAETTDDMAAFCYNTRI